MAINNDIQKIIDEGTRLAHTIEPLSNVKSGKEATVYKVLLDDQLVAMKLYKNPDERSFKNTGQYLMGKHYHNPSQRKASAKGNKFAKELKHQNWVKREYFMLEKLYALGAPIPKPVLHIDNAIFMEFLGNQDSAAPRLCDVELTQDEARRIFKKIIQAMIIFWDFGIAHADLSAYNILWWNSEPYIIDFPQAIDKRTNPNAAEILDRDLRNVAKYFDKFIEIDFNEIKKAFSSTTRDFGNHC